MLDIYAPRIRLEFRLTDRDGEVVSSGPRDLRDPLYLTRALLLSTDPWRYEKNLVLERFRRGLAGRPGGAPAPAERRNDRAEASSPPAFPRDRGAILCGLDEGKEGTA